MRLLISALALTASLAAPTARAQSLGGMLDRAKARAAQAKNQVTSAAPAAAAQAARGCDAPPPPAPSADALTVDNNIAWTEAVLANCRPLDGEISDSDTNWRRLHLEFKAPLRFSWDRSYVEKLTPKKFYLMGQIENLCQELMDFYNPNLSFQSPLKDQLKKLKRIHLTTVDKAPAGPGAEEGYRLSWDQASGTCTIAIATLPGRQPNFSNLHGEELRGFLAGNIK